jgi:hypothetical protein
MRTGAGAVVCAEEIKGKAVLNVIAARGRERDNNMESFSRE